MGMITMDATLAFRANVREAYTDVYSPRATAAILDAVRAGIEEQRREAMATRLHLRASRFKGHEPITFLPDDAVIAGTAIRVADARSGNFDGGVIPHELRRQWIQGTGPATRPRASTDESLRSVAYALLSGADGWMFDGEDALGQVETMSLDNQRNLRLAIARDPRFMKVAKEVAAEMNTWSEGFLGRPIVHNWQTALDATTVIFRPRGLHLEDRHVGLSDGSGLSASIVDVCLFVAANHERLTAKGSSLVLYLPKIQTASEAGVWDRLLLAVEASLNLTPYSLRTYVLVEQLEASFQLMEIRAVLGRRFVGFNTGRWDYINSVADALAWSETFINPNIDAITMTYGYMRNYEDRVRRAVNTPDRNGQFALWQGGMEPNIPVGSVSGVKASMAKAVAGAERECEAGASGKWVAHWKMVHIVRPVWEKTGKDNQLGRSFAPLTYSEADAQGLRQLEAAPRSVRGARDLISVALQYANAFSQGYQAAALKPADFFGNDDVLYLMEDMATGEIRVSILWEWVHKGAVLGGADGEPSEAFTQALFTSLLDEEYEKLVQAADRDVHARSKETTLPLAKEIVRRAVLESVKTPWCIDLLNLNLDQHDLAETQERLAQFFNGLRHDKRITTDLGLAKDIMAQTRRADS